MLSDHSKENRVHKIGELGFDHFSTDDDEDKSKHDLPGLITLCLYVRRNSIARLFVDWFLIPAPDHLFRIPDSECHMLHEHAGVHDDL